MHEKIKFSNKNKIGSNLGKIKEVWHNFFTKKFAFYREEKDNIITELNLLPIQSRSKYLTRAYY